jgi:repressor LexA
MIKSRSRWREARQLTPRQLQILTFIRDFRRKHGYSPTMQELADHLDVTKVTVFEHVGALEGKGLLHRLRHKARSLELTSRVQFPDETSTKLPLLGAIAAGRPIEAIEHAEPFDLEDAFVSRSGTFALKVRGDSMIDEQICDGDYVVVERRTNPRNGETVVAVMPDGEATLKKFYKEKGRIRLQAANARFKPMYVDQVDIQGVVIGVVRKYR